MNSVEQTKRVRVGNLLDYRLCGADTLREAVERDVRLMYGNVAGIEFYFGTQDGSPVSELGGKLVIGTPEVSLVVRVTLAAEEAKR